MKVCVGNIFIYLINLITKIDYSTEANKATVPDRIIAGITVSSQDVTENVIGLIGVALPSSTTCT